MAALFLDSSAKACTCSISEKPFMPVLAMHGSIDVSVWDDRVTGNQTQVNAVRHTSPLDFHYVTPNNPCRKTTHDYMHTVLWSQFSHTKEFGQMVFVYILKALTALNAPSFLIFIDKKCSWMFLWMHINWMWGPWPYYSNHAASEINQAIFTLL